MSEPIRLREVVAVVFRHKKKSLACGLMVMITALLVTALMQPRFRSRAMLFVRLGRENVALDPTATFGGGSTVAVPQARENEINSVVELLQSRTIAEHVVDQIGPEKILGSSTVAESSSNGVSRGRSDWIPTNLGPLNAYVDRLLPESTLSLREKTLETFSKRLSVSTPKLSTVIHISFEGRSPEVAQQVVSQLVDSYLEEHLRLNRTAGSHEFFTEQTQQIRQRLMAAEIQLRDLKNQTGMAAVEDQRKILVDRAGRLEDELLRTSTELSSLEAELAALNEKLDRLPETRVTQLVSGLPNQAVDLMRQQLYTLQLKEQELLSTFKEDTWQVQEIRRQIHEAQTILAKEEYQKTQSTTSPDPTFQQLHLSLHSKQTQAVSLRVRLEKSREQSVQAKADLEQLNNHELRIVQMRRDVALQEASFRKYEENLEQARIDQALKLERISNISVAQPATLEPRQIRPQVVLQLLLGALASLVSGFAMAFVAEYFDRSLKSEQDLEQQVALNLLVTVPNLPQSLARATPKRDVHAYTRPR